MNIFIVHAHPERRSFNGALTDAARRWLAEQGHDVVVSDLYAMGWDPRSGRANFTTEFDAQVYRQQAEETHATGNAGFAPAIAQEQQKLFGCDVLILQFPLWWFSMPAVLKGWVDRVFAMGAVYGAGCWYDRGRLAGRRAMLSITVGGWEAMYGKDGLNGDMEQLLFPIQHGILRFVGFDVLPPFMAWQPARVSDAVRAGYLDAYRERLSSLRTTEPLRFRSLDEYDPETLALRQPGHAEEAAPG